jgi:hypothetical protein
MVVFGRRRALDGNFGRGLAAERKFPMTPSFGAPKSQLQRFFLSLSLALASLSLLSKKSWKR